MLDLEFGRKYWLSRCFNLRSYTGLRGAWTKTKFKVIAHRIFSDGSEDFSKDRFTNNLWGIGLLGGVQPAWNFWCNFILYGNVEGSLLWGDFRGKKRNHYEAFNADRSVAFDLSGSAPGKFSTMQAVFDLALGFRWEENWCCDRYKTSLDLGWEHHIWLDHGIYTKSLGINSSSDRNGELLTLFTTSYAQESKNLGLGGLVLRFRFDF